MVEHFPGMQEALEYIPSTAKWKIKMEGEHDKKYNGNATIQIACRNNTSLYGTLKL